MHVIKPDWPAPAVIHAFTTTRAGGYSLPPYDSFNVATHVEDDLTHVKKNRHLLMQHFALPNEPFWLNQVHSTIIVEANATPTTPTADASYSQTPNVVCTVLTADCIPILVCNRTGTLVAAIHAGWRGLAIGVVEAAINALPVPPHDLLVWLGPGIGPTAFQVGNDVIEEFTRHDPATRHGFTAIEQDRWLGNLYAIATEKLHRLGVKEVYGGDHCTYTERADFYSFRRDNRTGRMASLIWIQK